MNQGMNGSGSGFALRRGLAHELAEGRAEVPSIYLLFGEGSSAAPALREEWAGDGDMPLGFLDDQRPDAARVTEVLATGAGLVVVASAADLADWVALAERHPVVFLAPPADVAGLRAAVASAAAAVRRQADIHLQLRLLQQRLDDRILIERAKGVLSHRLQIGEEQAYKRLRTTARRQRRSMRDVARSLLDADPLLDSSAEVPAPQEQQ